MRLRFSPGDWRPLIQRMPRGRGVALTFDDGPTPQTTPQLIGILAGAGAKATFFLSGVRVAQYPHLVADLVAAGHAVYGHGWEHERLESDPERAVIAMRRVESELLRFRPTPKTYLLRLPYNAGYNRAAMHKAMRGFHPDVQFCSWSYSTFDYDLPRHCATRADLVDACEKVAGEIRGLPDLDGSVILQHESPFDVPSPLNAEVAGILTPLILSAIAARGLRAVAMTAADSPGLLRRFVLMPAA